ncbi:hypothetical protein K1719_034297 [Acacia pycnantha]|nr:hypothetical protein K1719_034297 [Acacia pycnantha]
MGKMYWVSSSCSDYSLKMYSISSSSFMGSALLKDNSILTSIFFLRPWSSPTSMAPCRIMLAKKKNAKQLKEVDLLAKRCIRVNGEERPTMKEVAIELEGIVAMEKHLQEKDKDMIVEEHLLGHYLNNYAYGSTSASFSVSSSYDSIQKLVALEIIDGGR